VTLVAVICYLVFDDSLYGAQSSILIYFSTELSLLSMHCVVVIAACVKFQRLRFVHHVESFLDQSLLVVAVFGEFALDCFHLVSALNTITTGGIVNIMSAVTAVLSCAQV